VDRVVHTCYRRPMSNRVVGVMAPERRRLLLETAAREFARAGYERASLNRIIRSCGMSKSSFYYYLGSKEALFDAVVTEGGAALVAAMDVPDPDEFAGGDFWGRIERLLDRLVVLSQREPWFADFGRLFYLDDAPSGPGTALGRALAGVDAWLERALAAGRASRAVRDDLPTSLQRQLTFAVLRAMDDWSLRHLEDLDPARRRQLAEAQFDAIRRLLAA
jgi:AcrR family transcriptional regulator